jgi:hypothetical protein
MDKTEIKEAEVKEVEEEVEQVEAEKTPTKKEQVKIEIQAILEKYNCGIAMLPHIEADGIKITMNLVDNEEVDKNKNRANPAQSPKI